MRYSRSKYVKHRVMEKSASLSAHLPETHRFKRKYFESLLDKYDQAIVKPVGGWGGDGVISVSSGADGKCKVHYGQKRKTFDDADDAYAYVRKLTKGRKCIVQRKITLATVGGRPFDLRVMVQRKKGDSTWKVTGKLAKVAGAGYVITNVRRSHGKVISFEEAVRRSNIRGPSIRELEERIDDVALAATKKLKKYYRIRMCGMDIGLDDAGKVWIIEPNFTPYLGMFLKLKDRSIYRRIIAYTR